MKLNKIGNQHSELLKAAQIIPDDGFADGGEAYTDEELGLAQPQVNENDIIGALSYAKDHVMAADWDAALKTVDKAREMIEQLKPSDDFSDYGPDYVGDEPPIGGNPGVGGASGWAV